MEDSKIEKLRDEGQWTLWKFDLKIILNASDLWGVVSGATKRPAENPEAWLKMDAKAQKIIVTSLGDEPKLHIVNCTNANDMWVKLESVYEMRSEASIHFLQQSFFDYKKSPEDGMAVHISKIQKIAKQLDDRGEKLTDNMVMTKILMTLPKEFVHFYSSCESSPREERTIKNLTTRLCMEEMRLGVSPIESSSGAFVAKYEKKQIKLEKSGT